MTRPSAGTYWPMLFMRRLTEMTENRPELIMASATELTTRHRTLITRKGRPEYSPLWPDGIIDYLKNRPFQESCPKRLHYLGKRNMQDCGQKGRRCRGDREEAPVVGNLGELQSPVGPRREHILPRRQGSPLLPGRRILAYVKLLFLKYNAVQLLKSSSTIHVVRPLKSWDDLRASCRPGIRKRGTKPWRPRRGRRKEPPSRIPR